MSRIEQTAEDVFQSLTGYDELAITKVFGMGLNELRTSPFMFVRALVFVTLRRDGQKDLAAHKAAMDLTMKELEGYFAADTEVMPDEPVTEQGKGGKRST